MITKKDILREHYTRLLKKTASWIGLAALMSTMFISVPASAAQITARKATLSDSTLSSTTDNVAFSFTFGSAYTVKGIKFQVCNSPLATTACAVPTGATFANATATFNTGTGGCATFAYGSKSATDYNITYATGNAVTSASTCTGTVNGLTNPSTTNLQFYLRITTFTDTAMTLPTASGQDYGAVAVSTANQVTVNANVQESLAFCVYTGANCGAGGNSVNIGQNPGTDNVLSASQMYGGTSKMDAATNAGTGYVITYVTTSPGGASGTQCVGGLSSTSDCIADAGSSAVGPPAVGTGMFGINLKANTTTLTPAGAIGANASGGAGGAIAPYGTADQVAFQAGSTPRTVANTGSAPSANTTYTVTYAAQAANATKPGAFSVTFTWVATGTF